MLGYCGLDCGTCPIHLASLEPDASNLERMKKEILRLCQDQYGLNLSAAEITDCDGCTAGTGRLFSGCARCPIRACAVERGVTSCARCRDFACGTLQKHLETDPAARTRLEAIREAR